MKRNVYIESISLSTFLPRGAVQKYMETETTVIMEFMVKFICAGLRIQVVFYSTFLPKSYSYSA